MVLGFLCTVGLRSINKQRGHIQMEDEKYDEQFITADMIKINMFNFFSL